MLRAACVYCFGASSESENAPIVPISVEVFFFERHFAKTSTLMDNNSLLKHWIQTDFGFSSEPSKRFRMVKNIFLIFFTLDFLADAKNLPAFITTSNEIICYKLLHNTNSLLSLRHECLATMQVLDGWGSVSLLLEVSGNFDK